MSISALRFFDSKNAPQPLGLRQAAPAYPQVYGKTMGESFELSDFSNFSIYRSILTKGPFIEKLDAGGKPSTWFPPGRLVEHIYCITPVHFNLI